MMNENLPATLRRGADMLEDDIKKRHGEFIRWTPWYIEAMREVADELEQRNSNHWFRPKDELPKSGDAVLALVNGKPQENVALHEAYQIVHYYDGDGWVIDEWPEWEGAEIVCWTPLPEPPEKEGQ